MKKAYNICWLDPDALEFNRRNIWLDGAYYNEHTRIMYVYCASIGVGVADYYIYNHSTMTRMWSFRTDN